MIHFPTGGPGINCPHPISFAAILAAAAVTSINDNNNSSQSGFKAVGSSNYPGFRLYRRQFTDIMNLSMRQSLLKLLVTKLIKNIHH